MSINELATVNDLTAIDAAHLADLTKLRRDLHSHPELRFSEHRTSQILASRLGDAGFRVRTGFAGTAVVGTWDSGRPGPTLLVTTEPDVGLVAAQGAALARWARAIRSGSSG